MRSYKQALLITLIWTIVTSAGNSQTRQFGTLFTLEGDTISGLIQQVMWNNDPRRINHFLFSDQSESNVMWEAKAIRQFSLGRDPNANVFYGKIWPHNGLRDFLKPKVDGKAQLFIVPDPLALRDRKAGANRVVFDSEFQESVNDAYYVSTANSELLIRVEKENYDLVLGQMLRDCTELTEQIGKRKFRFNNLDRIIGFYNGSCAGE